MSALPSSEKITTTLLRLNPNKARVPDGLTSGFSKAYWSIIGLEVLSSIGTFFTTGFLLVVANSTILSLVPKHPGASAISEYRHISCCSTIYKTILKILVAKLKPILNELILPNQTTFVQSRLLIENTILATEVVDGYHKQLGPPRITLKVDIAKAFDTLSWDFLFICLSTLQLPSTFIHWLKARVCTPSYTIGYNGTVQGFFKGRRGLRQGDPVSPYLFVVAMNCLSQMLNRGAEEGKFGYHAKCSSSKLTHLCFADDLLIFTDGKFSSVQAILAILDEFAAPSGLKISLQKTSFVSCGVPLLSQKLSMHHCAPLIQLIKSKVNSWSARSLSYAGRLLLLNTVINGITNF